MSELKQHSFDVVIIGGGAAGLMAAIEAGKRGRQTLVVEKAEKVGNKILISGGGRCNFTNIGAAPDRYVSENKHFMKSALRRYTQADFISMVEKHNVAYHEKKLGQLFCDNGAASINEMLLKECDQADVAIWCDATVKDVQQEEEGFVVLLDGQAVHCKSVIVASGGLSIPKMGANDFAHRMARKFDLIVTEMKPGLVPFTFESADMKRFSDLTGVAADAEVSIGKVKFRENILFTHKGMSGPAILQISSFWDEGKSVKIDFLPDLDLLEEFKKQRNENPKSSVRKFVSNLLPNKLAERLIEPFGELPEFGNCSDKLFRNIAAAFKEIHVTPNGTEGYRKAEVTVGGVSTSELSSKTMETKSVPGLYFIGEAVDVTGFLGGYNFQWAWSSGYVAGQYA
ncbi:aminoacetone oxidase family FAD-binding enzyme [Sneathiella sp. P13V-1]|uniref:NAD(P)/FAD-dependent oxidoreductase n=1 Tax=Sneathiella sp. P13V-1 TaxID=2697366 RepID=UPI00187B1B41|nr:NAD(P)/FAD-dependent oxidoreductase [Sneathiella sp. P13V-1]MBE7638502.1 aminoacetone oxidase family FAD-binding enzyme [Sneathiella sp. P13V-1]